MIYSINDHKFLGVIRQDKGNIPATVPGLCPGVNFYIRKISSVTVVTESVYLALRGREPFGKSNEGGHFCCLEIFVFSKDSLSQLLDCGNRSNSVFPVPRTRSGGTGNGSGVIVTLGVRRNITI